MKGVFWIVKTGAYFSSVRRDAFCVFIFHNGTITKKAKEQSAANER